MLELGKNKNQCENMETNRQVDMAMFHARYAPRTLLGFLLHANGKPGGDSPVRAEMIQPAADSKV